MNGSIAGKGVRLIRSHDKSHRCELGLRNEPMTSVYLECGRKTNCIEETHAISMEIVSQLGFEVKTPVKQGRLANHSAIVLQFHPCKLYPAILHSQEVSTSTFHHPPTHTHTEQQINSIAEPTLSSTIRQMTWKATKQ